MLYARASRKFVGSEAICKGLKEIQVLLLYARVLRKFFGFDAIRKGLKDLFCI